MKIEIRKWLRDITDSIDSLEKYLGSRRDFQDYKENKMLRRAVERELEIIGEAVNRILKADSDFPLVNGRRIVDLRNLVIHGYDKVDDVIVWGIISKDIPRLAEEIELIVQRDNELR